MYLAKQHTAPYFLWKSKEMGNCQAIDASTVVVEHPNGKVDKYYWSVSACEIMRMNPGHHVALLISTTTFHHSTDNNTVNPVRLTKIKLLKSTDSLVLGQVYRLITTQEVMKGLSAKKHAKLKKELAETLATRRSEPHKENKVCRDERDRPRSTTSTNCGARSKTWQPSLQSISESAS